MKEKGSIIEVSTAEYYFLRGYKEAVKDLWEIINTQKR